ncbi:disease resistance protein TIR-NBS-LRR class, partial [Prunus dulcis]
GTRNIKGIMVKLPKPVEITLNPECFRNMYSPNLTCMDLRGCQFLEKIPDLSGIPNIEYLILSDCTSLVELDDSVGFLDKLVDLDLQECVKLMRFAQHLDCQT